MTYTHRINAERRLLAALVLWPRAVDLDAHHFAVPEHAEIYRAILDAGDALQGANAIPLLRGFIERDTLSLHPSTSLTLPESHARDVGRYYEDYLVGLFALEVHADDVDALVSEIRVCPRCGR